MSNEFCPVCGVRIAYHPDDMPCAPAAPPPAPEAGSADDGGSLVAALAAEAKLTRYGYGANLVRLAFEKAAELAAPYEARWQADRARAEAAEKRVAELEALLGGQKLALQSAQIGCETAEAQAEVSRVALETLREAVRQSAEMFSPWGAELLLDLPGMIDTVPSDGEAGI